jgi:hypothetical protein
LGVVDFALALPSQQRTSDEPPNHVTSNGDPIGAQTLLPMPSRRNHRVQLHDRADENGGGHPNTSGGARLGEDKSCDGRARRAPDQAECTQGFVSSAMVIRLADCQTRGT